jgi:hypothetical protein
LKQIGYSSNHTKNFEQFNKRNKTKNKEYFNNLNRRISNALFSSRNVVNNNNTRKIKNINDKSGFLNYIYKKGYGQIKGKSIDTIISDFMKK